MYDTESLKNRILRLERKLLRVESARAQAEHLLETKSLELYRALQETERTRDQLDALAHSDVLTGLANRRFLEQSCERLSGLHARQADIRIGLLLIDLDAFKPINDTLGHEVGDQVLVQVADRLLESARVSDCVARIGGDEFVILCTQLNHSDEVRAVAERVRQAIMVPFQVADHRSIVSASIGAAMAEPGETLGQLLRRADSAMYCSKRNGKNRLTMEINEV